MIAVPLVCLAMLGLATLVHFEALRTLSRALPAMRVPPRSKVLVAVFGAFLAHALEIALYGFALFVLIHVFREGTLGGTGSSFASCFYFSAETYSSLGFGDAVPLGPLRLASGMEALNGLLLIGWSASFLYIAMERFWNGPKGEVLGMISARIELERRPRAAPRARRAQLH